MPSTSTPDRVRFASNGAFHRALKARVDRHFTSTGQRTRDLPRMYTKSAVIVAWFIASWTLLVFWSASLWTAIPLTLSLGLAVAGIGMGVMHDANHDATSRNRRVNRIFSWALDAMGASSHVWRTKHNRAHHTWTNIAGHDDDIDLGVLGRLAPDNERRPVHRFQHLYMWALYCFLLPKWVFWDDVISLRTGRLGRHKVAAPSRGQMAALLAGKLTFVAWSLVIPLLLHPPLLVLAGFALMCSTVGLVLATTFQLAHCVEEADFPMPVDGEGHMSTDWAEHQLATTVDFARNNRLLTWYMGGLNFQVVHHLFPRICHLHYPAISRILQETADEFDVQYRVHRSLGAAIASHYRILRRLGQPEAASACLPAGAATTAG